MGNGYCHHFRTFVRERLAMLKGVLFIVVLLNNQHAASALTQSHQGSASTNEFKLTGTSPDARIQISSSTTIYIVQVDPPPLPQVGVGAGLEQPKWKVSLELLAMQLCDPADVFSGDRLKVVYSDPNSIKSHTWKVNASYYSSSVDNEENTDDEERELNNIQANQIVLIPEGRWILSAADLVATLYQEPNSNGTCPEDTAPCFCPSKISEDNDLEENSRETPVKVTRCIPSDLVCNSHPNCGPGCQHDESKCSGGSSSSSAYTIPSCVPPEKPSTTKTPSGSSGAGETTSKSAALLGVHAIIMIFISRVLL